MSGYKSRKSIFPLTKLNVILRSSSQREDKLLTHLRLVEESL